MRKRFESGLLKKYNYVEKYKFLQKDYLKKCY
jgi:hypothetical protein